MMVRTCLKVMPLRGWRLPARHKVPAQAFYMCGACARFQIHFQLNPTEGVTHVSMDLPSDGNGTARGRMACNSAGNEDLRGSMAMII